MAARMLIPLVATIALATCGPPDPPDHLLPPVAQWFTEHPDLGQPRTQAAAPVPNWANGPRQRVYVSRSPYSFRQRGDLEDRRVTAYLMYLADNRVVTVWGEDSDGIRSPEPVWEDPTWIAPLR